MKMLMLLLIAELGLVVGCGYCPDAVTKTTPPVAGQTTALRDTQVLAIARLAVATNDTWLDRAEFEKPRRQADGSSIQGIDPACREGQARTKQGWRRAHD